jgi:hypothetical protein
MFGEFSVQELGYAISIVCVLVRFSLGAITTGSIMESGMQGVETHVFEKRRWEKRLKKQAYLYPTAYCLQCRKCGWVFMSKSLPFCVAES